MKRTLTTLALTISAGFAAFAQQDPQFSQNMFNKLATNPGYAGTNQAICANLIGRQQWMGFVDDGIPKTYLLSVDANVWQRHGFGLTVFSDQLGFEKTFHAKLAYSFHFTIGAGTLGIGPELGMVQKSVGGPWVATDPWESDPAIPTKASDMTFDVGLGAFYVIPQKLYFGISSTHLTESNVSKSESRPQLPTIPVDYKYTIARHYYVTAGYQFPVGSTLALEPSVFVKSDAASTQLDVNIRAIYNNLFWGGVSYRLTDAIVAMVGIEKQGIGGPNGTLKVGYSYDVTTSAIKNHSSGSHELMLGYCFKLPEKKKVTIHENVRFP
jgi:type IX secretion system PorP/SprF family membrane protein